MCPKGDAVSSERSGNASISVEDVEKKTIQQFDFISVLNIPEQEEGNVGGTLCIDKEEALTPTSDEQIF